MIFSILFFVILSVLSILTQFLPGAGVVPFVLPWGIDEFLVQMSAYFHGAINTFPYLEVVLRCFLYAFLFEIALIFIRLFLGSRTPTNVN